MTFRPVCLRASILSAVAFALIALVALAPTARAHPLHTSMTVMHYDARSRSVVLSVRVFEDDFTRSAAQFGRAGGVSGSRARQAYVKEMVRIVDGAGKGVVLTPCGERRVGDMLWLCFQGRGQLAGGTVASRLLFETFNDQVNIVQAVGPARRANILFTRGDRGKRIPAY